MRSSRKQKLWLCAAEPFPRLARPGPSKSERGPALPSSMGMDAALFPASTDAHVHFYSGGASLTGVQLREAKSTSEFRDRIATFARSRSKGEWILGGNWDHENWKPAEVPSHQLIDSVTSNNPVFVNRLDGHMALANAAAMKLAGITKSTEDVPGGVDCSRSRRQPDRHL